MQGIALRFFLLIALCFACCAALVPQWMMRVFTNDSKLVTIGASYLRFMSISYLCWGVTKVYLAVLRSIGRVVVSTLMNVLAFSLNVAVNTTLIAGVFRAGGDSRFGFVCDAIDMWCYAVPLGFIAAFVLRLPVLWVYFLLCKWPWVIRHYRKGTWLKNITRDDLFLPKEPEA